MSRFSRRLVLTVSVITASLMLVSCSGSSGKDPGADLGTPSPSASAEADLVFVALGDSWPNGDHCDGCETFVGRYATGLEELTGRPVTLIDRTTAGGDTGSLRESLETDGALQGEVAEADVLVISTGVNDLDSTGALEAVGTGTCGDGNACLEAMYTGWRENYEAILAQIDELRAGAPTALRLVTAQNVFVSDPTIGPDYGLPDDFALTTGAEITQTLTTVMCDAAESHGGSCVDVAAMFNGQDGTQQRDENSLESHQEVADALIALGVDELP